MSSKKGISPLIATVLLIGFAIAIAILIWFWYGNLIKGSVDKLGNSGKIVCSSDVQFRVKSICVNSTGGQAKVTIENKGSDIDAFQMSFEGKNGIISTADIGIGISATQTQDINGQFDPAKIGTLSKVTVIPVIIRSSIKTSCVDQKQDITSLPSCK